MLDWKQINGAWYCYQDGEMVTGWVQDENSKWYYLYANETINYGITYPMGAMAVDWVELNSKWYYFLKEETEYNGTTHSKGEMVAGSTITINNTSYTFDGSGVMQQGSDGLVSDDCINFIKGYEVFHPEKYDDGTGVITQGYGCTGSEISDWGDLITEPEASDKLIELLNNEYAKPIKENLDVKGVSLTQNQFDAIVSCAYNIGTPYLFISSLYTYVTNGGRDADTIKIDFCMWNKVEIDGNYVDWPGLTVRRTAESNIFNYGIYDSTH